MYQHQMMRRKSIDSKLDVLAKEYDKLIYQKIIKFKLLNETAKTPTRATDGSAGFDLYANESVAIPPEKTVVVTTGVYLEIPEGMVGLICSRSGLAVKKQLSVLNSPGVIDSDYRGELCIILTNHSPDDSVIIHKGDRIGQILFFNLPRVKLELADELTKTQRDSGGLGSTGV